MIKEKYVVMLAVKCRWDMIKV